MVSLTETHNNTKNVPVFQKIAAVTEDMKSDIVIRELDKTGRPKF